jgi:hypothetical protein
MLTGRKHPRDNLYVLLQMLLIDFVAALAFRKNR